MAIGYYNYSPMIAQGEQTVNQLTGLGQQIGHAIETHAATQSAQAMLPVIQEQYANGMQKLSLGDQSGIGDVVKAAGLAGQNPFTQHLSNQFMTGMTQVNELVRNKQIADARVAGSLMNANAKITAAQISHGEKGPSATELLKMGVTAPDAWKSTWQGDSSKGIKGLADIATEKGLSEPQNLATFMTAYLPYSQQKNVLNKQGVPVNNTNFDEAAQTAYNTWAKKAFLNPNDATIQETFSNLSGHLGLPSSKAQILAEAKQAIAGAANPKEVAKSVASKLQNLGINPSELTNTSNLPNANVVGAIPATTQQASNQIQPNIYSQGGAVLSKLGEGVNYDINNYTPYSYLVKGAEAVKNYLTPGYTGTSTTQSNAIPAASNSAQ